MKTKSTTVEKLKFSSLNSGHNFKDKNIFYFVEWLSIGAYGFEFTISFEWKSNAASIFGVLYSDVKKYYMNN